MSTNLCGNRYCVERFLEVYKDCNHAATLSVTVEATVKIVDLPCLKPKCEGERMLFLVIYLIKHCFIKRLLNSFI